MKGEGISMSVGQVIVKATIGIALINLASKFLGFIRDMVIAHQFGATGYTDAYLVGYTIPFIMMNILALALATVVVPIFSEYESRGARQQAWQLFNTVTTLTAGVFLALIIIGMFSTPLLVKIIAPGLSAATALLAQELTRIMLPMLVFMGIALLFNGLLNANNKFAIPALTVAVANVVVIISTLVLGPVIGIHGVAIGTFLGVVVAAIMQVPALWRVGFRYRYNANWRDAGVQKVMSMMLPVALGVSVNQLYIIIDRMLASGLAEGSIAALSFANKLVLLPLGLFVMAIGTAFYPTLTRQAINPATGEAANTLRRAFRMVLMLTIPAGVGLFLLRYPIIQLLFERGAFDARATEMTALALMFFSIGLAAQSANVILTRGFYALHDTKTPVKLTVIAVLINLMFSLLLIGPMQLGGLALATSIAAIINSMMLAWFLARRMPGLWDKKIFYFVLQILTAATVMGFAVYYVDSYVAAVVPCGTIWLLLRVIASVFTGFLAYVLMNMILRTAEIFWLFNNVKKLFKRKDKE